MNDIERAEQIQALIYIGTGVVVSFGDVINFLSNDARQAAKNIAFLSAALQPYLPKHFKFRDRYRRKRKPARVR